MLSTYHQFHMDLYLARVSHTSSTATAATLLFICKLAFIELPWVCIQSRGITPLAYSVDTALEFKARMFLHMLTFSQIVCTITSITNIYIVHSSRHEYTYCITASYLNWVRIHWSLGLEVGKSGFQSWLCQWFPVSLCVSHFTSTPSFLMCKMGTYTHSPQVLQILTITSIFQELVEAFVFSLIRTGWNFSFKTCRTKNGLFQIHKLLQKVEVLKSYRWIVLQFHFFFPPFWY